MRRDTERFAVTVTLTDRERDLVLALVDATRAESMMQLVRMLLWNAAEEYGLRPQAGDFERARWGTPPITAGRTRTA